MRCSSCEILLDRYVEGTLPPRQMAAISAHLRTCDACATLVNELRVVDALLATTEQPAIAPNFTFAVMAEVRSLPVPARKSVPVWLMLALYLVVAWLALAGAYVVAGERIPAIAAAGAGAVHVASDMLGALAGAVSSFGASAPLTIGLVSAVLTIDIVLAAAFIFFYRSIRPRLVAALHRSEAS